ncbi:MAG: TIR domain-containing protein [Magnetococcus sp. YQC-9]
MARIFISHSSQNNPEAIALRDWLLGEGWDDLFLDLDPERGIIAGERWERALHEAANRCDAVLFLVSQAWLDSGWCRKEFHLARRLNKRILGILIEDIPVQNLPEELIATWQLVNLASGDDHQMFRAVLPDGSKEQHITFSKSGLTRLKNGLNKAGLDPRFFAWPPEHDLKRPPYRGMRPLEAEDAGIFFGREAPIIDLLATLRGLREAAPPRFLVILGASGSGKSSFLRAGILPRLHRDEQNFLTLPIVRPEQAVLTGDNGFLHSLEQVFDHHQIQATRKQLRDALDTGSSALLPLLTQLTNKAKPSSISDKAVSSAPTLVLSIDQGEELFLAEGAAESQRFLALLKELVLAKNPNFLTLFTIRSDSYERLQTANPLEGVKQETYSLPPMPRGAYQAVITGPAARMSSTQRHLKIDPKLTETLLQDIGHGGGKDALPLLAFTLERLYIEYGGAGELRLDQYLDMGGIKGAIEAAVERAFKAAEQDPALPRDHMACSLLLRRGLIPWLAGIDPETQAPRRRIAKLAEIPVEAQSLIHLLIDQRLLATDVDKESGETTIEPAHESLLRQWGLLQGWLLEDFAALSILEGVQRGARDWEANERDQAWLNHTAGRLEDAEHLKQRDDLVLFFTQSDRDYLKECREQDNHRRDKELDEARKLAEVQKKVVRRTRVGLVVALCLMVVAGIGAYVATKFAASAKNSLIMTLIQLGMQEVRNGEIGQATAYFEHALRRCAGTCAHSDLTHRLDAGWKRSITLPIESLDLKDKAIHARFRNQADALNVIQFPDAMFTWKPEGHWERQPLSNPLSGGQYSWFASSNLLFEMGLTGNNQSVPALNMRSVQQGGRLIDTHPLDRPMAYLDSNRRGSHLLLMNQDRNFIQLYSTEPMKKLASYTPDIMLLNFIVLSDRAILTYANGDIRILPLEQEGFAKQKELGRLANGATGIVLSEDETHLLVISEKEALVYDLVNDKSTYLQMSSIITSGYFFGEGTDAVHLVLTEGNGNASLYSLKNTLSLLTIHHFPVQADRVVVNKSGNLIATILSDGTLHVHTLPSWQTVSGRIVMPGKGMDVGFVGNTVYTILDDRRVIHWKLPEITHHQPHQIDQPMVKMAPQGQHLVAAIEGAGAALWNRFSGESSLISHPVAHPVSMNIGGEASIRVGMVTIDGDLHLFDQIAGYQGKFPKTDGFIGAYAISRDGDKIVVGNDQGEVQLRKWPHGEQLWSIGFPKQRITGVTFSPDGRHLATALSEGEIHIQDVNNGKILLSDKLMSNNRNLAKSQATDYRPGFGSFSHSGRLFASGGEDGTVHIWNLDTLKVDATVALKQPIRVLHWEEDDTVLYLGTIDGTLRRYDIGKGLKSDFHILITDAPREILVNRHDNLLIISGDDGKVWFFDRTTAIPFGLPFDFSAPTDLLFYEEKEQSALVQVSGQGQFTVHPFEKNSFQLQDAIGIHLDTEDQLRILPIEETIQRANPGAADRRVWLKKKAIFNQLTPTPKAPVWNLTGQWEGEGMDIKVANWHFKLDLTHNQNNSLHGRFHWTRTHSSVGNPIGPAGTEDVVGTYFPEQHMVRFQSIGVKSTTGLGGLCLFQAYVTDHGLQLEHGVWGSRGSYWGLWSGMRKVTSGTVSGDMRN